MSGQQVSDATREQAWARDYARVAAAIAWLDEHRVAQPRLAEVAAALHLSPGHLQRTFTRFAGTSPTRFLRWLTAGAARELLHRRTPVLEASTTTGLSSPGRLHDLMVTVDALTPGEVAGRGAGVVVRTATHPSPLGPVRVAVTERGVAAVSFLDGTDGAGDGTLDGLRRRLPEATFVDDHDATAPIADRLRLVLAGGRPDTPLRVVVPATNLQLKVWEALLRLPAEGEVTTYGELARAVDHPRAVRAVASAVGRNPVAALIPCHRVLRATGELGGYRWGTTRKRALLAVEAARRETDGA